MGSDVVCNPQRVDRDVWARLKPQLPVMVWFTGLRASVGFVEILVDSPLDLCRQRIFKGPGARADRDKMRQLTGIDGPYEPG